MAIYNQYLIYLQHYYWMKKESGYWASGDTVGALTGAGDGPSPFPMSIEYMFEDALLGLRPNLVLAKTLEDVVTAVDELETKLVAQLPKSVVSLFNYLFRGFVLICFFVILLKIFDVYFRSLKETLAN